MDRQHQKYRDRLTGDKIADALAVCIFVVLIYILTSI